MPKYSLDGLGHEEFERLCQSLVQQVIGPGAKVYGMGSDGSREATFHGKAPYPSTEEQWDGNWIFQAKFHDVQQIGPKEARRRVLAELDDELSKISEKYGHPCDNFVLMTNVSLTPVFQVGTKDKIDIEIAPKYGHSIKHIHVWGAEEICRFLDAYPNTRQTYAHFLVSGDIIARLLGLVEAKETDLDELVELYCQGCFVHEESAVLDDAGDVDDRPVALQRVFIDVDAKPPTLADDPQVLESLPQWLKQASQDEERTSALSYLLDDSILGLVLVGGPGEGKSTLGQYIAQIHRARLIGKLTELGESTQELEECIPRVPFRILLREYAQWIASRNNSDSLFHYLAGRVSGESGRDTDAEHVHEMVKASPIVLILDGLDEVPEKTLRTRVLENIASFVNQVRDVLKGDLRVIATTRPYGYSEEFDPTNYLHLTLQKLSPEKAVLYARRWTDARERRPTEAERIRNILEVCVQDRVVRVLTQTPLQVTILLVIIRARGTPPKQREELFERYMDIIYQREQKTRPELLRTEQDIIYGLHKYLAYVLHRRAEKDRTAALMEVSEFRKRVEEYLVHSNPLLREEELEAKASQIMTEASQRLVLIESPQEGRVGFGLATTREFFAAAHLVDTAKDTRERDSRFKAIARSPHWRNAALFFAGRVGRTRPGEAPSMIDVCREIDTEGADRFLRRGADLVMEMVDDRVLRETHNEIGAIQYGLTLLDRDFIGDSESFLNRLKGLSEEYRERVISPWMEDRLKKVVPENLESCADVYRELFGIREPLHNVIRRASEFDSEDIRLWSFCQAMKDKIVQPWVIEVLEELVETIPIERIATTLGDHWPNLRLYLGFSLSPKARTAIALALLAGTRRYQPPFQDRLTSEIMDELSVIMPEREFKDNSLLLSVVSRLVILPSLSEVGSRHQPMHQPVNVDLPAIANPKLKMWIDENARVMRDFCETFSEENEPLAQLLVSILSFLLEPHSLERYINMCNRLQDGEQHTERLARILSPILARVPDEETQPEHHKMLYALFQHYESEEQYVNDIQELNEVINKESKGVKNHPHKLYLWLANNCDPTIEESLDREILSELRTWLELRQLPASLLPHCVRGVMIQTDLEFLQLVLRVIEDQLRDQRKSLRLWTISWITHHGWEEPRTEPELAIVNRLRRILEESLAQYSSRMHPERGQLECVYWSSLHGGVVEEKHMAELYEIVHSIADFSSPPWRLERGGSTWSSLISMLESDNRAVARLAAVSLLAISRRGFLRDARKALEKPWIGSKYWEFAKDKEDLWRPRYIEGMAQCRLEWAENSDEWFEAIREADTKKLQSAWGRVIAKAGYCEDKDRDALVSLLLRILESGNAFAKPIRIASLGRLDEIVSEVEPIGFDEEPLNLPLSRRAGTVVS